MEAGVVKGGFRGWARDDMGGWGDWGWLTVRGVIGGNGVGDDRGAVGMVVGMGDGGMTGVKGTEGGFAFGGGWG